MALAAQTAIAGGAGGGPPMSNASSGCGIDAMGGAVWAAANAAARMAITGKLEIDRILIAPFLLATEVDCPTRGGEP